ncbi:MAG: FAD-dependent monooxygenase [Hyphomicrobiaceae bacterium]|nr:FAD-dependent monooxygenase [Hyphomicrobiaceae bacterium]
MAHKDRAELSDILVVGGGLTGLPLALALRGGALREGALRGGQEDSGLSVTVISKEGPGDLLDPEQDGRAFALSASSRNLLQLLGVWEHVADKAQPMTMIDITDSKLEEVLRPSLLHMDNEMESGEAAAYVVEAHILRGALAKVYAGRDDIKIISPADVTGFEVHSGSVDVQLASGEHHRSRLLVASDGRSSDLRAIAGIKTVDWPASQWGIVATIAHTLPHNGRAVQHFLPDGPFAVLPLTENRVSLVWTEQCDFASKVTRMDDEDFLHEVRLRMGNALVEELGDLSLAGPRNAYPLTMLVARDYVKERFALVGDAAHGMHWIAGQGLNYGLRDVAALAQTLIEAHRLGLDIGSLSQLQRYEQWRRFDSFAFTAGMVVLNKLFSNDNMILRSVRDFGLNVAGHLPFAKSLFTNEAAGLSGNVPKMLKGEVV